MKLNVLSACVLGTGVIIAVLGFIAGQWKLALVPVHTEIEIDASKEAVWGILADFGRYPEWNPNTIEIHGAFEPGATVAFNASVGGTVRELDARIDQVERERELRWTGPVSAIGRILFWGEHRFVIEEISPQKVRLVNSERFGGLAALPMASYLRGDVAAAYEAANTALKERAERGR